MSMGGGHSGCVYVCVHACTCRFEPCSEGSRKPNLRIMGLSHQEQWKVLERGNVTETRDGGGERLDPRDCVQASR